MGVNYCMHKIATALGGIFRHPDRRKTPEPEPILPPGTGTNSPPALDISCRIYYNIPKESHPIRRPPMNLVKKIDIHVHTSESAWICRGTDARYATPEELIHIYDTIGVEKGVILPEINVEGSFQISSNYEIWNVVQKYPHRFAWFANLDPRQGDNSPHTDFTPYMKTLMSHGARGVGKSAPICILTTRLC